MKDFDSFVRIFPLCYSPSMIHFLNINDCTKNLHFSPEIPWPKELPLYCYEKELLCGFERSEGLVIPLEGPIQNFPQILKAIYPQLSFQELGRLTQKLQTLSIFNETLRDELWSIYGYRWKDSMQILLEKMSQLPMNVQQWMHQKKMGPQDLSSLRLLTSTLEMESLWTALVDSSFSKSEATKSLELIIELLLMEIPAPELLPPKGDSSQWLKRLHEIRMPLSTQQDREAESKIKSLAWPLKSEARWNRRGDRSGIELKLFFSHPQELKRILLRLEQIENQLQSEPEFEDLWSTI